MRQARKESHSASVVVAFSPDAKMQKSLHRPSVVDDVVMAEQQTLAHTKIVCRPLRPRIVVVVECIITFRLADGCWLGCTCVHCKHILETK